MKNYKIIRLNYALFGIKHDQSCDLLDQGAISISFSVGSGVADFLEEEVKVNLVSALLGFDDFLPNAPYICFDMDVQESIDDEFDEI